MEGRDVEELGENDAVRAAAGRSRAILVGGLLLCAGLVVGLLLLQGGRSGGEAAPAPGPAATTQATSQPTGLLPTAEVTREEPGAPHTPVSGLPTIAESELPPQAWETLRLIDDGGPFPFRQDDSTFFNREGILPDRGRGYYREYTVQTPGWPDRGARRIVAGAEGDLYYTEDHYSSFEQIEEGQ